MFYCGANTREIRFLNKVETINEGGIIGSNIEIIYFLYDPIKVTISSFNVNLNKVCFAWSTNMINIIYSPTKIRICTINYNTHYSCAFKLHFDLIPNVIVFIIIQ